MSGDALPPIQDPLATLTHSGLPISGSSVFVAVAGLVFIAWALYSLIVVYHWLRYSHSSLMTFPALIVHAVVSFALMSFALTGAVPYL